MKQNYNDGSSGIKSLNALFYYNFDGFLLHIFNWIDHVILRLFYFSAPLLWG